MGDVCYLFLLIIVILQIKSKLKYIFVIKSGLVWKKIEILFLGQITQPYLQSYSPTVLQAYSPTVLQSYSLTVLQSYSPTVLQSYMPTVLQSYSLTGLQSYRPTVLQSYRPTVLQAYNPTVLQAYSPTVIPTIANMSPVAFRFFPGLCHKPSTLCISSMLACKMVSFYESWASLKQAGV